MSEFSNILLIQLGDIGDIVLTTPTILAVKETYPDARVSILVRKPFGSLLLADPYLHEVVESTQVRGSSLHTLREYLLFARRLRRARYDLVVDLRTGDRGAILSFLTGARMRVGREVREKQLWRDFIFTKIIRDPPAEPLPTHPGADQSLRVVRELGINTANSTPRLHIAPADQIRARELLDKLGVAPNRIVTINPFSRWKYKEWSNAKWGEVIDRLWMAHRIPAVLIGSPEEEADCKNIVAGREGHAFNLAGKTTLSELAAVISISSLHLGVDSAAPHIAEALGTPTVTIHGPTDWRAWRKVDEQHRVVIPDMDCVPCNMMGCNNLGQSRCLEQLNVDLLIDSAEKILLHHELFAHR